MVLSTSAISLSNRAEHPLVVAIFDIDFFKRVNDNFGHDAGDQVLRSFSKTMTEVFRDYDIVGRIGCEEFAVCLPDTSSSDACIACERLRQKIENSTAEVTSDDGAVTNINITVSVGLVLAQKKDITIDELLKQADSALYFAKEHGRNQVINVDHISNVNYVESDSIEMSLTSTDKILSEESKEASMSDFDGIDFTVGVNNVLGDESLFKEILVMFYQDHHLDGQKLQKAIEERDMPAAKHLAHTLKGVACSVGAMELFETTKALDFAINENQREEFDSLLALLLSELTRVMKGIKLKLGVS
ncbi:MAG: diguanylate cyclase [Colwellia sp.]|nr:diguanylate cyclase [Colwellia sp.]